MILDTMVKDVLRLKDNIDVYTTTPERTVFEALKLMAEHNIGALPVVEGDKIIGMISERDYARKVVLADRSSQTTLVRDIMNMPVLYVMPSDPIEGCLQLMLENRIRHLPVVNDGRIIGLISMGDVVRSIMSHQESMIDDLTRYISGSYSGWFDSHGPGRAVIENRYS